MSVDHSKTYRKLDADMIMVYCVTLSLNLAV